MRNSLFYLQLGVLLLCGTAYATGYVAPMDLLEWVLAGLYFAWQALTIVIGLAAFSVAALKIWGAFVIPCSISTVKNKKQSDK